MLYDITLVSNTAKVKGIFVREKNGADRRWDNIIRKLSGQEKVQGEK